MSPIRALFIANRGEIARRISATARDLGIRAIVACTEADLQAPAAREADSSVLVPSYLDMSALIAAAQLAKADALHPGYGFLAENEAFAQLVIDAGLCWVGPAPASIAAMGSKAASRQRMVAAGVAVVPGYDGSEQSDEAFAAAAASLGFPLLVKASAGGGGKGMRVVHAMDELPGALAEARRLARSAFGDDRLLLERYLQRPRHVEVQILGDSHGEIIALWERECSVQRRHQKVIEEAPSPALSDPALRARILTAAVQAARTVDYVGAGTVEMMLEPDGAAWFLEMNTRLQVEHRVTEAVTGIDLVAAQLAIAEGAALADCLPAGILARARALDGAPPDGWSIEARLYAEDPDAGYLPGAGPVLAWSVPELGGLVVDTGVETGSVVGTDYDPMLAKIVARGPTREAARRRLVRALEGLVCLGLPTNRDHLRRVLEHPAFIAGELSTSFLEKHAAALAPAAPDLDGALVAAVVAGICARATARRVLPSIPAGWRNNPWRLAQEAFEVGGERREVPYRILGPDRFEIGLVPVRLLQPGRMMRLEIGGIQANWTVVEGPNLTWVHGPNGGLQLRRLPDLPEPAEEEEAGGLHAPMPGKVVRVEVAPGQEVEAGEILVVLEAMKMEQAVRALAAGRIEAVRVEIGQQVDAGDLLVVMAE